MKQMSREGFEKLQSQLETLVTVRRAEVAQKLKEARAFGDLSENAEYDEAKNEQGILEAQIAELEDILANTEVVDEEHISVNEVGIGSVVKIRRTDANRVETYQIVGTTESDPLNGKLSDESPIGRGLMRKKAGDLFSVETPSGQAEFEVIEISR
ncbi:MAG: transcription elongation factor GreA [Oscillospiraceae bacterium]|jgi:transcription elongation factor GreA|nr:transcription elongation factor GreA [Oscillospiraceae bacterium]